MVLELEKEEIVDKILKDSNFTGILKSFKNEITSAFKIEFDNEYKNGLCNILYGVTINDKLEKIILPIFSSEKTTTWNFSYLKDIKRVIPANMLNGLEDHQIIDMIYCPLYFLDKYSGEIIFLSLISARNFIDNGMKGKNGYSTYFWNDKLPNKYSINKKELVSDVFIMSLPHYTKKQLKEICKTYATKFHAKFADVTKRNEQTKIKNISNGLYAQISVYLDLLKSGYDVTMDWHTEDDLGIDIQLLLNDVLFNIDVKSTQDENLKISKNRKETDFYAVCTWNKNEPILEGYVFKFDFWKSEILETEAPEVKNEMFIKSIKSLNKSGHLLNIDGIFGRYNTYKIKKMKRNERLFNVQ